MSDPYQILGIVKSASDEEIKQAYKKLAKKFHPDANPDPLASEKFKEISQAYEQIKTPEKRKAYDDSLSGFGAGFEFNNFAFRADAKTEEDLRSIFRGFGRDARFNRTQQRPQAFLVNFQISLSEAFTGREAYIEVNLGNGQVQQLRLVIPAGIKSGDVITFPDAGPASEGNKCDIHVKVIVGKDKNFQRDHDDLVVAKSIDCFQAMLGDKISVIGIDGKELYVTIPAGTQPNQILRIKGQGMPNRISKQRGDILVKINVTIPKRLTEEQTSILKSFKGSS